MKKSILFVFMMMAFVSTLFAQSIAGGRSRGGSDYDPMVRPNVVKLNLSSLAYRNIALQYERVLGNKISVACGVRFMPNGSVPFANTIDDIFDYNYAVGTFTDISALKVSSLAITPEFRFYPKHAGKGFYLAPYFRYRTVSLDLPVDYTDDFNKAQKINATGNFNSYIGGIMIGSQFNLGPMVTLDWFIVGFQYGVTSGKLDIKTTQTLSANDQFELRADLEDFKTSSSSFNNIDYIVNANGGSISGNLSALGFRAFGLNLGFKF